MLSKTIEFVIEIVISSKLFSSSWFVWINAPCYELRDMLCCAALRYAITLDDDHDGDDDDDDDADADDDADEGDDEDPTSCLSAIPSSSRAPTRSRRADSTPIL